MLMMFFTYKELFLILSYQPEVEVGSAEEQPTSNKADV
jgi:hypothetical protein